MSGHDWIRSQLEPCPECKQPVKLHQTVNEQFRVCCMNACCNNMKHFDSKLWGRAIVEWNRYVKGEPMKEKIEFIGKIGGLTNYGNIKRIRESNGQSMKEYSHCYTCKTEFLDDSATFVIVVEKKGNRLCCKNCFEKERNQ